MNGIGGASALKAATDKVIRCAHARRARHPGLRLLLFALSLLPVNAWVLYRQIGAVITSAGQRFRLHLVTLESVAAAWQEAIQAQLGMRPIVQALPLHAIP